MPEPQLQVPDWLVLADEPLARHGGTPHVLRQAYRRGGTTVYVGPNGLMLSDAEYSRLSEGRRRSGNWRRMARDPELLPQGTVRHPDHATVVLREWHRVLMNTEQGAKAMRHVAFLD